MPQWKQSARCVLASGCGEGTLGALGHSLHLLWPAAGGRSRVGEWERRGRIEGERERCGFQEGERERGE